MKVVSSLLCLALLAVTAGSVPPPVNNSNPAKVERSEIHHTFDVKTIKCESNWGQRKYCRIDTKGGVKLKYQFSEAGCWQDDTWGYDSTGIWVSNGCSAEFEVGEKGLSTGEKVAIGIGLGALAAGIIGAIIANRRDDDDDSGYYPPYESDRIKCSSNDMRYHACDTGRNRRVELARQISDSPCRYGYSWGYNRNQVWVNHGCRAEFYVYR